MNFLMVTLVTISPMHPAKAEVLLTFTKMTQMSIYPPPQKYTAVLFFELLVMKSIQPTQSLFIAAVHRPPGPYTAFLTEFLSDLVVVVDNIHIFGD
jgi:hypothetical protein